MTSVELVETTAFDERRKLDKKNIDDMNWQETVSPKGDYHLFRKQISVELTGKPHVGTWGGGHPFEAELTRVPAGAKSWPLHQHTSQHELYIVVSGSGVCTNGEDEMPISTGDFFIVLPDQPHTIINNSSDDLVYYVIAENERSDIVYYPNSDKWFIKPQRKSFRMDKTDYYDREE